MAKGAYEGLRAPGVLGRDQGTRYPGHPGRSHVGIPRMSRKDQSDRIGDLGSRTAEKAELDGDVCSRNTCRSKLPDPAWDDGEPPYGGAREHTRTTVRSTAERRRGTGTQPYHRAIIPRPPRHS